MANVGSGANTILEGTGGVHISRAIVHGNIANICVNTIPRRCPITDKRIADRTIRKADVAKVVSLHMQVKRLGVRKCGSAFSEEAQQTARAKAVSIFPKKKAYPTSATANPCMLHESACELGTRLVPW